MSVSAVAPPSLYETTPAGTLRVRLHFGQTEAYDAPQRFILILAGLQSGKTCLGPLWLLREMQRKGPGDYLVGSPTFTLMELKALPEFKRLFEDYLDAGEYKESPVRQFMLNRRGEHRLWGAPQAEKTRVLFGHAQDPDALESGTYKAAWLDEAGQKKFRYGSWVSVQGRLAIYQGRALLTTTPYFLGWMKHELYDPWVAAGGNHPEIAVVNFWSIDNPAFPIAEWERAQRTMPRWLFNMRYRGQFERPAGLIYDCWDDDRNVIPAFAIPESWPRFLGLDFGGVNTAGLFVAKELTDAGAPTGRYIGYREYWAGGLTAKGHVQALLRGEPRAPRAVGGAKSEAQWRRDFAAGGLGVAEPPIWEVEPGILRLYGAMQTGQFVVFDTLKQFRDQIASYSRVLDDAGQPTEAIEDKETYHLLDAGRYLGSWLFRPVAGGLI